MDALLAPLDQDNARSALAEACETAGLDPADAELIRLGENAVFRLHSSAVVARVARTADRLEDATREIQVSRWLAAENLPAIRALNVSQPIVAQERVVVLWESASDAVEYGTTTELGAILRQLHALPQPSHIELPTLAPFDRAFRRIDQVATLSEADREFLRDRCTRFAAAYAELDFELPTGPIHGDANVGNLIRDREGHPVLSDLDGFVRGPREWDLVLTAMYYERYGWHTKAEYEAFVEAYGHDIMAWSGYETLRDARETLMITWLAQNAAEKDGETKAELDKRIGALRSGASRLDWRPF